MQCCSLHKDANGRILWIFIALVLITKNAWSATDGGLGSSSEGTSVITIVKQDAVQITGIDNLEMGIRGGSLSTDLSVSDAVCVFSSTAGYNLTVTSANNDFILTDAGASTDIPYSLEWTTSASTQTLLYNTALLGLTGDSNSLDCGGSTNATISVSLTPASFNAAEPGSYQDTVTILVQPE